MSKDSSETTLFLKINHGSISQLN